MKKYIEINGDLLLTIVDNKIIEGEIVGVVMGVDETEKDIEPIAYNFLHNKEVIQLPYEQKFYQNYEEFRENTPIENTMSKTHLFKLIGGVYGEYYFERNRDSLPLWYFDKKPIRYYWWESIKKYEIIKGGVVIFLEGFLPDRLHTKQEECLYWNDTIIHKMDGSTDVKEAVVKKLLLNDTQKEIFERFKSILKEMSDANMKILCDVENLVTSVINLPANNDWYDWCGKGVLYTSNTPKEQECDMDLLSINSDFTIHMDLE